MKISENYYCDLSKYVGSEGYCDYEVRIDSTTVYNGRAYEKPDYTCRVLLNDIARDYLGNELPVTKGVSAITGAPIRVECEVAVSDKVVASVTFDYDYTEDRPEAVTAEEYERLVEEVIDPRMPMIRTLYSADTLIVEVDRGATSEEIDLSGEVGFGNLVLGAEVLTGAKKVAIVTDAGVVEEVDVESVCSEWAFYYVNGKGGWDWFIPRGRVKFGDAYERTTLKAEDGERILQNEITESGTAVSGWLTDAQSAMLHNMLSSGEVWIYRLPTAEWWRVVLTDTSAEYKNYHNNGAKLVSYTIGFKVTTNYIRR